MKFFDIICISAIKKWLAYDSKTLDVICYYQSSKDCIEGAVKAGYTLI